MNLHDIPGEKLEAVLANLEATKHQRKAENKLASFTPWPKQREFFSAGKTYRERLLLAGNQVGKSLACNMETAYHATGRYPDDWWDGYRFDRAPRMWACGETGEVLRETTQRLLLGEAGAYGTGCIPKDALLDVLPARGLGDAVDTIRVRHVSGGVSTIALKSYASGRERFQGATIDFAALDEEPDEGIFHETLTRLNATSGPLIMCFTPLKGMSLVVKRFLLEPSPTRIVIGMTLEDAGHYTEEQRKAIIEQYPEHQRPARTKGIPTMGSGAVFPIDLEQILVEPFECPSHFIRVGGVDFGYSHPSAFCELWWDRDIDCVYLVRTLRLKEHSVHQQVERVRHWKLRWMWPHDGRNQTLAGAGESLASQYRDAGLDFWHEHVSFADGGNSVEAGLQMMLDRMRGGRWKVFKGQNDPWMEEARLLHRDERGLLVKEGDDGIAASRYGMMGLRHGCTEEARRRFSGPIKFPNVRYA